MNVSDASRGWGKSKFGGGDAEKGWLAEEWGGQERDLSFHTGAAAGKSVLIFFQRAGAPSQRHCKGTINLPCTDVIALMDIGLLEPFISTRAFLHGIFLPYSPSNCL